MHNARYSNNLHYLEPMAVKRLTRDERKALTRELLLDAAGAVFSRRGFHAASVEEIAEEAGFTTGAIYSHFGGKEELFLALLDKEIADDVRHYREIFARAQTLDEQARAGADDWMAQLHRDPDAFALFIEFWAYAVRYPDVRAKYAARFSAFREAFAGMVEEAAGEYGITLAPGVAGQLGTVVNALGNGIALEKLADPDAVPDELLGWSLSFIFTALLGAVGRGEFQAEAHAAGRSAR